MTALQTFYDDIIGHLPQVDGEESSGFIDATGCLINYQTLAAYGQTKDAARTEFRRLLALYVQNAGDLSIVWRKRPDEDTAFTDSGEYRVRCRLALATPAGKVERETTTVTIFPETDIESMARAFCVEQGQNPDKTIFQHSVLEMIPTPHGLRAAAIGRTMKLWETYKGLAEVALKHRHDAAS